VPDGAGQLRRQMRRCTGENCRVFGEVRKSTAGGRKTHEERSQPAQRHHLENEEKKTRRKSMTGGIGPLGGEKKGVPMTRIPDKVEHPLPESRGT